VTVRLLPDDAFGKRDVELLHEVPVDEFPPGEDIRVGGKVTGHDENGEPLEFRVTDIRDGTAFLDGNHPLAGQTLVFEVEIQGIRDASGEELAQGKVLD
jgi:FKBP-type peptidyl-prolyl cis-trans isomerase SlyD